MSAIGLRGECAFCHEPGDWRTLAALDRTRAEVRCLDHAACTRRLWRLGVPKIMLEPSWGAHEDLRVALLRTWTTIAQELS